MSCNTDARSTAGFTLIEIMVVIAVIAVLASVVSPMVFRNVADAKQAAARTQITILGMALDAYRLDNDYYPSTDQGLAALVTKPDGTPEPRRWRGPYLKQKTLPLDPWGRAYIYVSPGVESPESYDLHTFGRDGTAGGDDEDLDVESWH